jgi:hypothetical protein
MHKKFLSVLALMLLMVFLAPTVIKLGHQHDHEVTHHTGKGNNFQDYHQKCPICNYEFSVFSTDVESIERLIQKALPPHEIYSIIYCYSESKFSFFLRAPPAILC